MTLDPSAGPRIHYWEGACRAIAGMIGGLLIGLAIKANLILGILNDQSSNGLAALLGMCMVAGISERLVPSFIRHVETSSVGREGSAGDGDPQWNSTETTRSEQMVKP